MKPTLLVLALTGALLATPARTAPKQDVPKQDVPKQAITFGRFGSVALVRPEGPPRSVALVLSPGEEASATAKVLAGTGALVLVVNLPHFLEELGHAGKCAYPAGDLEALSQFTQKELDLPEYLHPTLVGAGPGAALAYAALAQAPENTFRGVLSLGFRPELTLAIPICRGNGLSRARMGTDKGEVLLPVQALTAPWLLLPGAREGKADLEKARTFTLKMEGARVVALPEGVANPEARRAALLQAYTEVSTPPAPPAPPPAPATAASGGNASSAPPPEPVGDLPLIEVPAAQASGDSFALLMSGDGGWAGIDKHLAAALNAQGMSVVGWDSLRYFWKRRTPEDTARDVGRAISHYLNAWGTRSVVLVGYSRGADVMPATVARLPAEVRQRVALVALVAPSRIAEFEVHVTDLLGGGGGNAPVLPEVQALGGTPVLCLYGDEELKESLCPLLAQVPGAKSVMLQGGHHFGGDYARVARTILDALGP
jgi:type IV secretory pathway VirJ component